MEFADGESGTTLATAADRRKAEPAGSIGSFGAVRANQVGANQEVRRLARRWPQQAELREAAEAEATEAAAAAEAAIP